MLRLADLPADADVVDLEQPRRFGDPTFPAHRPGTLFTLHRRHELGLGESRTSASGVIVTAEHSGTHIDALCHQAEAMRLHGGIEVTSANQTSTGFSVLGIETVAPLLAPAVLVDVAGPRSLEPGKLITLADVTEAVARDHVEIRPGDVVLVRTGNGAYWGEPERYMRGPGVATEVSEWLAAQGVRAVGADNVAWDLPGLVDPVLGCTLPGHVVLIVRAGIHIVENLNLEELSARHPGRMLFICLPLKIVGGTGSPVRPVAVIDAKESARRSEATRGVP